jgi:hypothetical protein
MKKATRRTLAVGVLAAVFAGGYLLGQVRKKASTPPTLIHFVAVKWRAESSEAGRQKVLDGIKTMATQIPGIKNVWIKTIRIQVSGYNAVYAIEFASRDAADDYRDHPAHKEWEKAYSEIRETSISMQASN